MKTEFQDALKGYHRDFVETDSEGQGAYKPLAPLAIISLLCGILSSLIVLGWALTVLPILGLATGFFALRKILASPDDVGGFRFAATGITLSLLFCALGWSYLLYAYHYEVPLGYVPVTFEELAADPKTGKLPQAVLDLAGNDQRVFIEGEMYPGKHLENVESFVLLDTNTRSAYTNIVREPTASIVVRMVGGRTVTHRTGRVRVGGLFKVEQDPRPGESPYRIDADVFR